MTQNVESTGHRKVYKSLHTFNVNIAFTVLQGYCLTNPAFTLQFTEWVEYIICSVQIFNQQQLMFEFFLAEVVKCVVA